MPVCAVVCPASTGCHGLLHTPWEGCGTSQGLQVLGIYGGAYVNAGLRELLAHRFCLFFGGSLASAVCQCHVRLARSDMATESQTQAMCYL